DAGDAVGTQLITEIKKALDVPAVAIGGITADNIAQVAKAGADCVAVISAVIGADDVEAAARCLIRKFLNA
ncbi:TPA: thiamine phosphate synthase, partial [Candidatus Poribacteria bacterium]|nr:thiamine phosphate synthase [Candidatus Poribacteria bacterium]